MKNGITTNGRRKRASKGAGRLYKRDAAGKEHPADWTGAGAYWLAYSITNPDGGTGQRVRTALRDERGEAITDKTAAEDERKRILAPFAAGTRVDALRAIKARLADAVEEHAAAVEAVAPVMALGGAWTAFMDHPNRPQCSERTLDQYGSEFKRFQGWMRTHHPDVVALREITDQHAVEYAQELDRAQVSASTFNQHRNFLAMLWRVLRDDARLASNPWERVTRRKGHKLARRKRALEQHSYDAVLAAAESDPDIRDLFVMLAYTGQRLVDVVKLMWGSVDFQRGILTIHPVKTAARTGKAVHPPLFPASREVLNRRQADGKPFKLDRFVFPDLAAEYDRDNGSALVKRIGAVLRKAGLETSTTKPGTARAAVQYGAHSFRHYFITQAAAARMPAAMVKQITGHSTDDMLEHYQHIGAEYAVEMARRIGGTTAAVLPAREPLPTWARELVEGMTGKTWRPVKAALLAGGA